MFKSFAESIVSLLPITGQISDIVEYWIYNNLKIIFILFLVVFIISYLRTYFPPEKIRDYLKERNAIFGYSFAVIMGIISPFCTCSTIPLFFGLVAAGVPFGIIITFLFVSPMINFAAIVLLFSSLGTKIALAYIMGGVTIAILGSAVLVKMKMERFLVNFNQKTSQDPSEAQGLTRKERLKATYQDGINTIKQIFPYVLFGVTVGAGIHGFVPEEIITNYLSGVFSVPGAVIIGVPVYTDIMGVIPITESLIAKGLPIGTAVSFMMSVAALSLPQFILLKKAMKKELLFYYGATLSFGIIILGFLLNFFLLETSVY